MYNLKQLADYGIHLPSGTNLLSDAQPSLITTSNSGIPAYLANYMDPKIIEIVVAPMKAAEIVGESKKGSWVDVSSTFPSIEYTGETSAYGDYSNNGASGANSNFNYRESFHYQTITQWGELELERAGLAKLDWASRLNIASVLTLNKYQNKTYFYGVENIKNYGLLNDPNLSPSILPTASWNADSTSAATVYEDIRRLFLQLQKQSNGVIDDTTPMVLAMSPYTKGALQKTNTYNVNVKAQIKDNFPNCVVETAPEYSTESGELVQLIVKSLEGQDTATCAFTEKLRAHPVIMAESSFRQKKSQGTWGCIIFRPFLIASMIGV